MTQFECPICQKPILKPTLGQVSFFPFCSDRCRLVDLGKWLDSEYRMDAVEPDDPDDENGAEI